MLIGLTGLYQKTTKYRKLLFLLPIGGSLWLTGLYAEANTLQAGLGMAFLDLITLTLGSVIMRFMASTKSLTMGLSLVVIGVLGLLRTVQHISASESAATTTLDQQEILQLATDGELLVELKNGVAAADWEHWVQEHELISSRAFRPEEGDITDLDDYFLVDVPSNSPTGWQEVVELINESGLADWVEPNEVITLELLPAKSDTRDQSTPRSR